MLHSPSNDHPTMKRRSFFALASIAPIGLAGAAQQDEERARQKKIDAALVKWYEKTFRVKSGVFESDDGSLRLEVALIDENDAVEERVIETEHGELTIYRFNGEDLPRWVRPEHGVIKSFRFFWDKKEIPIPKRFWNDFGGCAIEKFPDELKKVDEDLQFELETFLERLDSPKVILSADGGTALIQWNIQDTSGCCGSRSDMRWMISKKGYIMRHRHDLPSMC